MAKSQPKIDDIKDLKKVTTTSDGLMSKEDKIKLDDLNYSDFAGVDHGHSDLHSHNNKTILDSIQEALTTTLKTHYDTAYTYSQVGHLPLHSTADKALILANARNINGIPFDGSEDITIPTGIETLQLLANYDNLNILSDGIYYFTNGHSYYYFPDLVCGTVGIGTASGKEVLRQYTIPNSLFKVQVMMIESNTYRRGTTINSYTWGLWERLITCKDMENYVTTDMIGTNNGGELLDGDKTSVLGDTFFTLDGSIKDANYILDLINPKNKLVSYWDVTIQVEPMSAGAVSLDFSGGGTVRLYNTAIPGGTYTNPPLPIPNGVTAITLKIRYFPLTDVWMILYTFIY